MPLRFIVISVYKDRSSGGVIGSIGCRWRHFCSSLRRFIRRWSRIKAVNFSLPAHNRGFGGARHWQPIGRGVEKVFRWFGMVIVGQKWIFDIERVIFQPWSGWGDRKSARTLRGYTLVIFPPKIVRSSSSFVKTFIIFFFFFFLASQSHTYVRLSTYYLSLQSICCTCTAPT